MSFVLPISVYEDAQYNDLRRGYLILLATLLEEYLIDQDINDYCSMIIDIERSCYDHSVEIAEYELLQPDFKLQAFELLYRTRIIRITKNLDINSEVGDDYLANNLLDGLISPSSVSKLSNQELSPMHNESILQSLHSRMNQKSQLKTSTLYKCRQCGKRETTTRSAQMRSLDEGETLIISCIWCGYKWFN